jgi:hypothetical protein
MTLRDLGFNDLQERTYRALLEKPEHDLTTLEAQVGAPKDDLRVVLAHLVDLGVARHHPAAPSGVAAGDPCAALGSLIERREDELLGQFRRVADTRAELSALSALDASRAPGLHGGLQGVEWIDGMADARERLRELSFLTRTSVYSVQSGERQLEVGQPLDLCGLRRGLDLRLIYERAVVYEEPNRTCLPHLMAAGARVRVTDRRVERLVIIDEQVAVVPIDPQDTGRGALVVRQAGLLTGFLRLFDRLWDEARELPADIQETPPEPELTDEDRRLLALLAAGNTDEVAARQVGVSVRHLRRRIARLTARLQASSRFEAGVEAVRRGWL